VLYILQLHQDHEANTAHVSSVSEFLLSQPVLSFALLDAGRRRLGKAEEFSDENVWSCTTGIYIFFSCNFLVKIISCCVC